jgi:hypothetical protein
MQSHKEPPQWLAQTRKHAIEYLTRFAHNPGLERIVREFNAEYAAIPSLNKRLTCLCEIAAKEWDFRKGRERFEVVANEPMDQPDSELGNIILEGANQAEMASRSMATLKHYDVVAVLGGANMSSYHRLRFALEQHITYNMLAFLGCERPLSSSEQSQVSSYAKEARTEFDLGMDAVSALIDAQPENMAWWKTQPEAWQEVNTDAEPAAQVISAFSEWVKSFGKLPVFVASPLILDYPFIKWYLHKFGGEELFEDFEPAQRTLDLASFTAGKLNIPLAQARRMQLPPEITKGMPEHSHKAIDDARGYGVILRNVLKAGDSQAQ